MENSDRFHEQQLGKINPKIKNTMLSEHSKNILSGKCDNEFIDPEKQPLIAKIIAKIKAKQGANL